MEEGRIEENPWEDPNITDTRMEPDTTLYATPNLKRTPTKLCDIRGKASAIYMGIAIVNFHHIHGPEVEYVKWKENNPKNQPNIIEQWPYLPFQALPDGAHSFEESFSLFTLKHNAFSEPPDTIFAVSCTRQIKSSDLIEKERDVTRSSVQKSIVILLKEPVCGIIQEKLSIVTKSFFEQRNFNDKSIIDILHGSLCDFYKEDVNCVEESDFTTGLVPQRVIEVFEKNTLVILKAMILEKRVVFYSKNSSKLCNFQMCLISLIPNLINTLHDSGSPAFDTYSKLLKPATSFQSCDRNSVLKFAGMPLQIFGLGGMFNPYCPLQHFESLSDCKFYTVGSSNAMILNMKSKLADVFVNIDDAIVEIVSKSLENALSLTGLDKKWMSRLRESVARYGNTADFKGNDDYIRNQFEDYLLGLASTVKFESFLEKSGGLKTDYNDFDTDQIRHFNKDFVKQWKDTRNYDLFNQVTDDHIFDVFEPKHIFFNFELKSSFASRIQEFYKKSTAPKTALQSDKSKNIPKKGNNKDCSNIDSYGDATQSNEPINNEDESRLSVNPTKLWNWYTSRRKGV